MDQYRIYLRSELGKLASVGDAEAFRRHVPLEWREANGLLSTADELTAMFGSQEAVDEYVASLAPDGLRDLTTFCGEWRNNGISDFLSPDQEIELIDVPVTQILLRPAEPCLRAVFERNAWRLEAIARDPELLAACPYRDHQPGEAVSLPICLAQRDGDQHRIFDGMHRAIQLVRNKVKAIRLCVVRP